MIRVTDYTDSRHDAEFTRRDKACTYARRLINEASHNVEVEENDIELDPFEDY